MKISLLLVAIVTSGLALSALAEDSEQINLRNAYNSRAAAERGLRNASGPPPTEAERRAAAMRQIDAVKKDARERGVVVDAFFDLSLPQQRATLETIQKRLKDEQTARAKGRNTPQKH